MPPRHGPSPVTHLDHSTEKEVSMLRSPYANRRRSHWSRRQWRRGFLRLALLAATGAIASQAGAADYLVTSVNDSGAGSLREAITATNGTPTIADTITFDPSLSGGTINLGSMLPMIEKSGGSVSVQGPGVNDLSISGQGQHRILFVQSGDVTIEGVTLRDGLAQGGKGGDFGEDEGGGGGGGLGAGGAVFVHENGNVTLKNVNLTDNAAGGGDGGDYVPIELGAGGGGGGGFEGDGGRSGEGGGGGGGGFGGDGADGPPAFFGFGGSGGGGLTEDGTPADEELGGAGGGEGGDGGNEFQAGQNGQAFGGGGGGGSSSPGGSGGDFGGGGGGGSDGSGGAGGFGGGGGGAGRLSLGGGTGGFGAGNGGDSGDAGDGGDGLGGAVFVRDGGQLTFENVDFSLNTVGAGSGGSGQNLEQDGNDGTADGTGLFSMEGAAPTWVVAEGVDASLDPSLLGGNGLVKSGDGSLNLTGGSGEFSDLQIDQGKLYVNSQVTSDVTVNADGTLGGAGTITGQLLVNGTLAPGNSIGTITVDGDATFSAGSTTQIEINDGGNTPGVHNDLIDVDGDATINGGAVEVQAEAGDYTDGTVYTFLTADSVTGTFDSITDNLAFFDAALIHNLDNVQFELAANTSDFATVGETFNQTSVGSFIDANSAGVPPAELQSVIDEMRPMTNQQVQNSLDQMSGAIYGSLPTANLQHSSFYLSQLSDRLRAQMVPAQACYRTHVQTLHGVALTEPESWGSICNPSETTAWVSGYGLGGRGQSDGNADGFRYGLGGTQIAVQRNLDSQHSLGGWGNLAWSNVRGEQLNESADLENYHFGSYLTGFDGRNYYLLLGGLGYDHGEVQRQVQIGQEGGNPQGRYDGWQANAYLERGLSLFHQGWNIQPYAALQYLYLRQGGFQETGGGVFDLSVAGIDAHSLRSVLGGRFSTTRRTFRGLALTPEFRAAWLHEFLDTRQTVQASFADLGGDGFAARGVDLGRDWVNLGGGLNLAGGPGARLFAGYDLQFNEHQAFHVGSGGVEFTW